MTKPEWGTKRKCLSCGAFFYDMKKKEFKCPKCGASYKANDFDAVLAKSLLKASKNHPVDTEVEEDELINKVMNETFRGTEDTPVDILEDASDLGDDESDMDEVMDGVGLGDDEE